MSEFNQRFNWKMIVQVSIAFVILVLFFLPWLTIGVSGFSASISGATTFPLFSQALPYMPSGSSGAIYLFLLLYFIPILAVVSIIMFFVRRLLSGFFLTLCIVTIAELAALVLLVSSAVGNLGTYTQSLLSLLAHVGVAFWMTIAFAIAGCIITAIPVRRRYAPPAAAPAPAPSGRFALAVTAGEYQGAVIDIPLEGIVIGRDSAVSNLILKEKDISRKHCFIEYDSMNGELSITDYSSLGTYVERTGKLEKGQKYRLVAGDKISLGGKHQVFEVKKT